MQTNIIVKVVVGENAINKLKYKFIVIPKGIVENGNTLVFGKNKVKSISMQNRSTSNSEEFSLGVTSLMGNVELQDYEGYLFYLTTNKLIGESVEIQVFDGTTLLNIFYTTKDWQYSNQNKQVSIELKGRTALWGDMGTFGVPYEENVNGYEMLEKLQSLGGISIEISDSLSIYLKKFTFKKAFISQGTLEEVWNKFCYATLLIVYESAGKIIVERF